MAEEPMEWETDRTGHKNSYEGFGSMTITVLGWIIVTLLTLFCLFTLEAGFFGTILALILFSVLNLFASSALKKMLL